MLGQPAGLVLVVDVYVEINLRGWSQVVVSAQAIQLALRGGGLLVLEGVESAQGLRAVAEFGAGDGNQVLDLREADRCGARGVESGCEGCPKQRVLSLF